MRAVTTEVAHIRDYGSDGDNCTSYKRAISVEAASLRTTTTIADGAFF